MYGWTWRISCGRSYRTAQGRWVDHRADRVDVGVVVDDVGVRVDAGRGVAVDVVRVGVIGVAATVALAVAVAVGPPTPSATGHSIGPVLITRLSK